MSLLDITRQKIKDFVDNETLDHLKKVLAGEHEGYTRVNSSGMYQALSLNESIRRVWEFQNLKYDVTLCFEYQVIGQKEPLIYGINADSQELVMFGFNNGGKLLTYWVNGNTLIENDFAY